MFRFASPVVALPVMVLVGLALALAGCTVVKTATAVPEKTWKAVTPGDKSGSGADPVKVQQSLLRFSDEFLARMVTGIDQVQGVTNALSAADVLRWKIAFTSESCAIASGPNAVGNLLDMTVFITATRMSVEEYWMPKVFGDAARPLRESCRNAETEIWQLAAAVLKPDQQTELREAIETWHKENPLPESVLGVRAVGLASQVARAMHANEERAGSVFGLLRLDPLASLDPATRELAQTRLFAERALYVAQKMPTLLRWQTELLSLNTADLPAVRQLITNSTEIAASVDRFADVAEKFPGQISREREEILKGLETQENALTPLVREVRQTLTAGSQMSTSLNATLTSFDKVLNDLGLSATNAAAAPDTNSPPFRIQDYGQTAVQMEAMARQLTAMFATFDQILGSTNLDRLSAQVTPAVQQAQAGGKEIVDYAFRRALLLVGIVLAAAVLYRLLSLRLKPAGSRVADR